MDYNGTTKRGSLAFKFSKCVSSGRPGLWVGNLGLDAYLGGAYSPSIPAAGGGEECVQPFFALGTA